MERLTERDEFGNADIIALSDVMPELYAELSFSETNALTNALNRLAAYEDTGLMPKEIKEFLEDVEMRYVLWIEKRWGVSVCRHNDIMTAEKEGRLTIDLPNEPLTLDELREMDGRPVWIVGADDAEIERNGYAVADFHIWGRENAPAIFWFGSATGDEPSPENYGKTWRAYRRRPEEGTWQQ